MSNEQQTKKASDFTDLELAVILNQTVGEFEQVKQKLQTVQMEIARRVEAAKEDKNNESK